MVVLDLIYSRTAPIGARGQAHAAGVHIRVGIMFPASKRVRIISLS